MRMNAIGWALALAAASATIGDVPTDWPVQTAILEKGENVYLKDCAACHGDRGNGLGPSAPYLDPRPRDFTSGMYKFRSTPNGELPTDADLMRTLENGVPGTQMPAWRKVLTESERQAVIAYIKTFSKDFLEPAVAAIAIPPAPESTPRSITEGRMMYMMMECWSCHGSAGRGDGKAGATLVDDLGRKIQPWNLTRVQYKAGNDPQSLYRTFSTGLNGTPMPAYTLDGFLIGGDVNVDPAKYAEAYDAEDVNLLKTWLRTQPGESALQRMSDAEKQALGERRKWALVHYIRTLIRKPNFLVRMFTEDTEITR